MDSLPTELLLAIIDFILDDQPSLAASNRLCKRWHLLTRKALYREPHLDRVASPDLFLRTVDTDEMAAYTKTWDASRIGDIRDSSMKKEGNLMMATQALSLSSQASSSGTTSFSTSITTAPTPSIFDARIPPGALVENINLSMLPHRWETIHFGHIQAFAQACPFISVLDLRDCALLRDNAVQMVAETLGPRNLQSLVLSGCTKITDLAILSLCAHAVQLQDLELSECDRITDISILEMGTAVIPPTSTSRPLSSPLPGSTPSAGQEERNSKDSVTPMMGISQTLQSLNLSHCTRITDMGIKELRAGAAKLRSLDLDGCYGILMSDVDMAMNEWEDMDGSDVDGSIILSEDEWEDASDYGGEDEEVSTEEE